MKTDFSHIKLLLFPLRLALVAATAVVFAAPANAQSRPFDEYGVITNKFDFWKVPPPPPPPATNSTTDVVEIDENYVHPELAQVKLTLISRFQGMPAAGFIDGQSGKPYFLTVGQKFEDFELLDVNTQGYGSIRLRRGDFDAEIPMFINPATTNRADVTSFGMPPSAGDATGGRVPNATIGRPPIPPSTRPGMTASQASPIRPPTAQISEETRRRVAELQARREELRLKQEEERKAAREKLEKMTPAERDEHIQDVNTDIIISGKGPPLPIVPNTRSQERLREAGFDMSAFDEATAPATPQTRSPATRIPPRPSSTSR